MWFLKLDQDKLRSILSIIMTEYITDKKIPITDKNIEKLRTHLISEINRMIEDRELCIFVKIGTDETDDLKELEEIVDNMINSLKIGGINNG